MFDADKLRIHGYPVIAWCKTEEQSTGPCGVVLVEIYHAPDPSRSMKVKHEYVVAWYRSGEQEWSNGHYITDLEAAWEDFIKRAQPVRR